MYNSLSNVDCLNLFALFSLVEISVHIFVFYTIERSQCLCTFSTQWLHNQFDKNILLRADRQLFLCHIKLNRYLAQMM